MLEMKMDTTGIDGSYSDVVTRTDPGFSEYKDFIAQKLHLTDKQGFKPSWIPDWLFDFQKFLVDWSITQGRGAVFADCGLGKTPMQLVWAENVVRHTNGKLLIVCPLAVARQTLREAEKFGIEATISRDGKAGKGITITNYERLHHFDTNDFTGMVCDESSILKNFKGQFRSQITEFMRKLRYRLLATATAAPNDFIEVGTSSEALGYMGYTDMLSRFFINSENNVGVTRTYGKKRDWRFKGHAQDPFWRWMAGWARALRRPSDMGFSDDGFILPSLIETDHLVKANTIRDGYLFEVPPQGMDEEREEQRRTLKERCEKAAELSDTKEPCVIWCNLNDEGDYLAKLLPEFVQINAKKTEKDLMQREEHFEAFGKGEIRGIIIKPKVGAFGLNWQHCAHTICFPTHSYEQYYQLVRRFWRFGQKRPVRVDNVTTESNIHVRESQARKAKQMDQMFTALVQHMNQAMKFDSTQFSKTQEVPKWL